MTIYLVCSGLISALTSLLLPGLIALISAQADSSTFLQRGTDVHFCATRSEIAGHWLPVVLHIKFALAFGGEGHV